MSTTLRSFKPKNMNFDVNITVSTCRPVGLELKQYDYMTRMILILGSFNTICRILHVSTVSAQDLI